MAKASEINVKQKVGLQSLRRRTKLLKTCFSNIAIIFSLFTAYQGKKNSYKNSLYGSFFHKNHSKAVFLFAK
jgi:hypothetical protein